MRGWSWGEHGMHGVQQATVSRSCMLGREGKVVEVASQTGKGSGYGGVHSQVGELELDVISSKGHYGL